MTQYAVLVNDEVREQTRDKTTAIKDATRFRNKERVNVKVATARGTIVFERPAPKKIRQSPKYSRVVRLPAGVTPPPSGYRVAYVRPRADGAILHSRQDGKYRIMRLSTGELLSTEYSTAGEAGDTLKRGI
jgi:hypothetical protein